MRRLWLLTPLLLVPWIVWAGGSEHLPSSGGTTTTVLPWMIGHASGGSTNHAAGNCMSWADDNAYFTSCGQNGTHHSLWTATNYSVAYETRVCCNWNPAQVTATDSFDICQTELATGSGAETDHNTAADCAQIGDGTGDDVGVVTCGDFVQYASGARLFQLRMQAVTGAPLNNANIGCRLEAQPQ